MADLINPQKAREAFATVCAVLENRNWQYQKSEEKMLIACSARGEDLPMNLNIRVNEDRSAVVIFSYMPYNVQQDKLLDMALAVAAVNNRLMSGCFDLDLTTGRIYFRITNCYVDSQISGAVYDDMLLTACWTIDEYNDKFLMISKGSLTVAQFMESLDD